MKITTQRNCVTEISFCSSGKRSCAYNNVDLDVIFRGPYEAVLRIPAFWAGDNVWKVRFSGPEIGEYTYESVCSDTADAGLHGQTGTAVVEPYEGKNPLIVKGRLRVGADRRHFEYADGTPFFWVGDTWWMGLSKRLDWPHGFRALTLDRVSKGFNVIQIIAGPYPDMDAWDLRGRNEAGFPFKKDFERINPDYYDLADLKISELARSGLTPCIVGMWGYYLPQIGVEKIKRFWRYLIARYGSYPVVWCIAGEATMAYYLSKAPKEDAEFQKQGWTEVMAYVREIDPYHNLISIHPTQFGRDQVEKPELMDFEMLQTGHGDIDSVPMTAEAVIKAVEREPAMPVVNAEVNYEGILGRCWQNIQRLCFYVSVMNGTAGHTYGANGVWQMSTRERPYGRSPHGRCWGNTPWQEACHLPGARQIGAGAAFIRHFPWWEMERHPEWVDPVWQQSNPYSPTTCGIPGKVRLVYVPMLWDVPLVKNIETGIQYDAFYYDPCTGLEVQLGVVVPTSDGSWRPPLPPEVHDWMLVMVAKKRAKGLADALINEGIISQHQLKKALALQKEKGGFIGERLVELGYVKQDVIALFLVEHFKTPARNVLEKEISKDVLAMIPKETCLKYSLLPVEKIEEVLIIAMTDPLDMEALEEVRKACPEIGIRPMLCNWEDFRTIAARVFGGDSSETAGEGE